MNKRAIGVVTTSRSDYGLYFPILKKIIAHPELTLLLYVSGMHLSKKFGNSVEEIKKDGFPIAARVNSLSKGDNPVDISLAISKGVAGFAEIFNKKVPDILLLLGDRFEMYAAGLSAIPFRIPLAHIHGGELTYGAIDEYFRHSLTKLSSIHFASTKAYAKNILQMGEDPERIIVSGAPALDNIRQIRPWSKEELCKRFGINFSGPTILVTFHPVTMEPEHTEEYIMNIFDALMLFPDHIVIFTYPNADAGNQIIIKKITAETRAHKNYFMVKNFGLQGYISIMAHANVMVGNSSSGIIEAASFKLPVVNIGTRQDGRMRGKNVIDVGVSSQEISNGIKKALSAKFRSLLRDFKNPYGDGHASDRIVDTLVKVDLDKIKIKNFYCLR